MRDRTWSPRRESRQDTFLTYSYGARPDGSAFHVAARRIRERGRQELLTGFTLRDGVTRPVAEATCEVARDDHGRPAAVRLRGSEEGGRPLAADGDREPHRLLAAPWFVWAAWCGGRSRRLGRPPAHWSPGCSATARQLAI
jgi:hypothetical protein